jgi:tetratricopeptide (TPR) repeat protein
MPPTKPDEHNMSLEFEIFDGESGAFSYTDKRYHDGMVTFSDLLEDHEDGRLGDKPFLAALERLLVELPELIDVHIHVAHHWHSEGKPKKALEAALRGLNIANQHIPKGFSGHIEWGHLENRAYLRLLQIALLSYMRLRRHRDAVSMIDLMLARNPNDNQGVRFLLGSEALRAGQYDRARAVLAAEADDYPPYFYELALCCMLKGDWVAAATALRRGFAANPYIAEHLSGNPYPLPLAVWHDSNLAEPETAIAYADEYASYWHNQRDSFAFLRWLFNHSKVLAERAAIMECKEALLWEHDATARSKIAERERDLMANINDALSGAIVVQREDRNGQMVWPWMQAATPEPEW